MNHKINSVQMLYEDASKLYNSNVIGEGDFSADSILSCISTSIDILKANWEGKDAGTQIQNVISIYNSMVNVRNSLAALASEASKVAEKYRQIQNANGAGFDDFEIIQFEVKTRMEDYVDNRDTININQQVLLAKTRLEKANDSVDSFLEETKRYYAEIMDNWVSGPGREIAQDKFDEFIVNSQNYKDLLTQVCLKISEALNNYTMQ